jgi:hypothetical protein
MGVRLGVVFSLSPMAALSISSILPYLHVCLFDAPLLLLLPLSALALHQGSLRAASRIAPAAGVQLIPIVVVLAAVIDAPLPLFPPPARWQLPHHPSPDASLTS